MTAAAPILDDPKAMLSLRRDFLACRDAAYWREQFSKGSAGFLAWCNLAAWTFNPRLARKHQPFNLWPVQRRAGKALWRAIQHGGDVLIDKSRDMGATWLCVAAFVWYWLFVPDTPLLMASRKEEYVDGRGNPDTLFWKADYLLANLPSWLRPKIDRRHMHLANLDNGSVISGEATNPNLACGARRKAILLDEFAAVENGSEILAATADATPCRIFNSTPKGRANAFADVRFSGKVPVITLHWKDHPDKGRGAMQVADAAGKLRWTSPWYEAECRRRTSRKEIAQELDIDYLASGDSFFDLDVCQRLRTGAVQEPRLRGEVTYTVETLTAGTWYSLGDIAWKQDHEQRRLKLWCDLVDGRPAQDHNYAAFADISHGTGASNSTLGIVDVNTREQVAAFTTAQLSPDQFAQHAVAICRWVGGQIGYCLLGWEANGPGQIFGREIIRLGYCGVLGNRDLQLPVDGRESVLGWWSGRDSKAVLLSDLRRAWAKGEYVPRELQTIEEAESYIYYSTGSIGPAGLVEDTEGARKTHGDRVIRDGGLVLMLREQPQAVPIPQPPPPTSFAYRQQLRHDRERSLTDARRY